MFVHLCSFVFISTSLCCEHTYVHVLVNVYTRPCIYILVPMWMFTHMCMYMYTCVDVMYSCLNCVSCTSAPQKVTLDRNVGKLGLSIIGGSEHASRVFGGGRPGIYVSKVS